MYGPVLTTIGVLGVIGNIISLVVFTRPTMKKSAINTILIGENTMAGFITACMLIKFKPVWNRKFLSVQKANFKLAAIFPASVNSKL